MTWRNQHASGDATAAGSKIKAYSSTNRALQYSLDETLETPPRREILKQKQCGSTGLDTMIALRRGGRTPISPVRNGRDYSPEAEEFIMTEGDEFEEVQPRRSNNTSVSYRRPVKSPTSPEVVYCSEVQTDTKTSMIKGVHEENRRLSKANTSLQEDISSLKGKLHEKAVLCEALRGKVKELALREKDQREEYEARLMSQQQHQQPDHSIAAIEQDKARLELLCDERMEEIFKLKSEKQLTEDRVTNLQQVVDGLAEGIAEIKAVGIADKDLELEISDIKDEKVRVEDMLTQQLHSLSNEYEKLTDECSDWKRRYRELRSSVSVLEESDDNFASQQHKIFDVLAEAISDSTWLEQVVDSATQGSVDVELRVGNSESQADRRDRISGKSVLDSAIMNQDSIKRLRNTILDALTSSQDGGGCDVQ